MYNSEGYKKPDMNKTDTERKYNATLGSISLEKGETQKMPKGKTENQYIARCNFILKDKSLASNYMTESGMALFCQSVKENFHLPIDIPNEENGIETYFYDMIDKLIVRNSSKVFEVWNWTFKTFLPYAHLINNMSDITVKTVSVICANKDFYKIFLEHLSKNPKIIDNIFMHGYDTFNQYSKVIIDLYHMEYYKTSIHIFKAFIKNKSLKSKNIIEEIDNICSIAYSDEEVETIEFVKNSILPLINVKKDSEIKEKCESKNKEIEKHINKVVSKSEKYLYSRKNSWRLKYINKEINGCQDITQYKTEEEYLKYLEGEKRKQAAISLEPVNSKDNKNIYNYCCVSFDFPNNPYYFYFTKGIELRAGDKVIVPFGNNNIEKEAVIMSVGNGYAATLSLKIEDIKTIIRKANSNKDENHSTISTQIEDKNNALDVKPIIKNVPQQKREVPWLFKVSIKLGNKYKNYYISYEEVAQESEEILYYTCDQAREILTAYFLEERNRQGMLNDIKFQITGFRKNKKVDKKWDHIIPGGNITIRDHGGYLHYIKNDSRSSILEIFLYSPFTHRYEVIKSTYSVEDDYCYIDISKYKKFVENNGNPQVELCLRKIKNGEGFFEKFNSKSILMKFGYCANANSELTQKERRSILTDIVDLQILSVDDIIKYLKSFISLRTNQSNQQCAISIWESDLEYIKNYNVNPNRFLIKK